MIIFIANNFLLNRSTIQLLRFPFSYFLMPVFFFALSFVDAIEWWPTLLIFFLIHFLLYPSSNGYNSFMDRDITSIGGVEKPMLPTQQLFFITVLMDTTGAVLALIISWWFFGAFLFYIICSRLYSYRGIRLKRFAVLGYITVIFNQGGLIFFMVWHGCSKDLLLDVPWRGVAAAVFLIGGFYPITQVYQHKHDAADNVYTISMLLGKRGTFIFCAIMYTVAFGLLFTYYEEKNDLRSFLILQIFFVPVIVYFLRWFFKIWKNEALANFENTMQMNWIASTCTSLAFITLIILNNIG